jgi:outer membrane protein TolC
MTPATLLTACLVAVAVGGHAPALDAAPVAELADTLHLGRLQTLAIQGDARTATRALERDASGLRTRNLAVARLPQFQLRGDASYQSEVIRLPLDNPGFSVPPAPKDRYELGLDADWTVWDGGLVEARQGVEQARLGGALAGLDAAIFGTRIEVTDAFFSALLLQEQVRELEVLMGDLEVRIDEMRARVEQGLALSGDLASLRAERLGARQQRDALASERRVSLGILSRLTGQVIDGSEVLALPDLAPELAAHPITGVLAPLPSDARIHPQFAAFDAQRDGWAKQAEVIDVAGRPAVSVFGQLNVGSPGYDQFNESLHEYWRAGVRVRWSPWTWNRRQREVEEMLVQQRLIDAQEAHFSDQLLRMLERPIRTIEYMRTALESDDEIIALREEAEAHALVQFEERAISVSAYTTARSDLQEARIARLRHRAELARAQAHYLITLGVELP